MFAILMLFIAPVVSRALEHARAGSAETTVMADCGMAMMMDDSACGYCVLLLHAPLLDVSHAPLFWSQSLASRPPPTHYLVPLFAHVVHTELQPRAPPVSFL
ncbi:DUF2946 domain-containing protein [Serratia marcescens]|uniref:DUF2946 domain-containing protein n=1 Tax=Serratia marcescens TaxID=615 RepID=UPI000EFA8B71|nr:DUF2946 domain-containing protein [Serratia marcescens]